MRLSGGTAFATAEEMKTIDEAAMGRYGVGVLSLMENAGAAVAYLAREMLGGAVDGKRVACLAGKGNNGGDCLVAARRLLNWGAQVTVVLAAPRDALGPQASDQLAAFEALGQAAVPSPARLGGYDLLLDGLLGYSARGPPREPLARVIRDAASSGIPTLAIDIPSGLDPDTGDPYDPCVRAAATLSLGLPKVGFLNPASAPFVGALYVGDVSLPLPLYERAGQTRSLFGAGPVARIELG